MKSPATALGNDFEEDIDMESFIQIHTGMPFPLYLNLGVNPGYEDGSYAFILWMGFSMMLDESGEDYPPLTFIA